jgi:hypothetical protein
MIYFIFNSFNTPAISKEPAELTPHIVQQEQAHAAIEI